LNHQSEKYDIVKLDHFPDFQGEKAKKYLQKPPPSQNLDLLKMSRTSSKKSSPLNGGLVLIYHGTFSVKRFPQKTIPSTKIGD